MKIQGHIPPEQGASQRSTAKRRAIASGLLSWGFALAAVCSSIGQSRADADHPPLMPMRDAVVTYEVRADGSQEPQSVKVWFSAQGAQQRIDSPDGAGSTILNRTSKEVVIALHKPRIYTKLEQRDGVRSPFLLDVSMQFKREGESTIAGTHCTDWTVTSGRGQATACVTSDGLILRENGVDADGINGALVAKTISYEPIPQSVFSPPAGYQEVHRHRIAPGGGAAGAPVLGPVGAAGEGAATVTPASPAAGQSGAVASDAASGR
ncbi:hypothetical protein AA23498_2185 [Acetobacter nitrogenifigens DSM 23921 = NBRC 105050]|uniref:Uncharacterized protein n=1 Tax=Acetobacter nitrogenifigens DSM 23921 = NBRC 105050 TaxID=1120919 RepID=A0A511X6X4_9PROT|nr:DUF4412 domain-containing protein [Acetobacter nitrogenifigens]GBQ95034.1 hypothetical protein AA23498_2185 [Acetobacter nitrogenifigens DSM 23921 = NBRC 105050]GEN58689.1 hypothetical protein ANI02nite_05730 [Acetobacter nitrogenifigens DSM 23921 = NBRC 105050]